MKKPVKLEGCGQSFCISCIVNRQSHEKNARKEHVDFGSSSSSCRLCRDSNVNVENALLQQASNLAGKAAMDASLNAKEKTKLRRQALSHLDLLLSNTNGTNIQALFTKAGILVHLKEGIEALHLLEQIEQVLVFHSMHPANQALLDQPSAVSEDEMERCQEVCMDLISQQGCPDLCLTPATCFVNLPFLRAQAWQSLGDLRCAIPWYHIAITQANMLETVPGEPPIEMTQVYLYT